MPNFPSIPDPENDINSLANAARALKEAVEILSGLRGASEYRAVLYSEFESLLGSSGTTSGRAGIADTLDPAYLDAILDRAAEAADELVTVARLEANRAFTELEVAIQNIQDGITDSNATIDFNIQSVSAEVDSNRAAIETVDLARVTDVSALSGRIDTIEATANSNSAAITSEAVTRANDDTAIAASVTTLSSTVSQNTADIATEATARANADSALTTTINSLTTSVNSNTSNISSIQTAYTTADTALSNRIDTVEAMTEAGTADGFYRLTAVSSPSDGSAAEFAVEVKASSSASFTSAGMRLQAFSNGTSRVKFLVDQFIIANSSGTYIPFTVSAGNLIANAITSVGNVSGLGDLALVDKLTSANLATYMDTGIISTAYIGNAQITDAKIASISASKISTTTLSAISANLGSITAGTISSQNGKMTINLNSNYILMAD